jgi:hypothetical protein
MSEPFRLKFDPDERFNLSSTINDGIPTDADVKAFSRNEILKLLSSAKSDYAADPSRKNRLKKVWAAALLRDYDYGKANYKYIRAAGYVALYVENYKAYSKLDALK